MSARLEDKMDRVLENQTQILVTLTRQESTLERNTNDVEKHIKRTDGLERKLSKIYMFALISAGFMASEYGPEIIKIIGIAL